ncbi:hypothetical protein Ddc_03049 [Ditylenchus destructor]|nr:hypothetical protein Ddc_03049 [Ditylenchus destructor]
MSNDTSPTDVRPNYGHSQMDSQPHLLGIADIIFQRHNRTVKYVDDGNLLILAEMVQWEDIQPRLMSNFGWILIFFFSILLNFVLLIISLSKGRKTYNKKVKCLTANLAFCNIILSLGNFIYSFLIDIYYDVDSFDTLIRLNEGIEFAPLWPFAKQIIHNEMVENFALAQALILFMMGIDRYMSLFAGYSPSVRNPFWFCVLSIVPYFFALLIFDYRILLTKLSSAVVHLIRFAALLIPLMLSTVFTGCSVARLIQKKSLGIKNGRDDSFSFSVTLMLILLVQIFEKFGLLLELLKSNFMFEIVIGDEQYDIAFRNMLQSYYEVSHLLFLISPLYSAIAIQLFVHFYRNRIILAIRRLGCIFGCHYHPKLDYTSETMRSIIAEQTRSRQLRTCYIGR